MPVSDLLARGDVWYNVPGKNAAEFISSFISAIRVPEGIKKDELSQACARREASSSTAMGRGVALPHPGEPMAPGADKAFVALAYPRFPVDWRAPDGSPVKAVFLIVSASRNDHLVTLSSLARMCGNDEFRAALASQAPLDAVVKLMEKLQVKKA